MPFKRPANGDLSDAPTQLNQYADALTGVMTDQPFTLANRLTLQKDVVHSNRTATEAELVTGLDASLAETVYVTLTANRVMAVPINAVVGQRLKVVFLQNVTGGWTLTFNASISVTGWLLNTAANGITELSLERDAVKWFVAVPRLTGPQHSQQTVTETVLVSGVDANVGEDVYVTLTANRVVGAPLNPVSGQRLHYIFTENGTGGWTLTWNAIFSLTNWALNTGANAITEATFTYNGTNWILAQTPLNNLVPFGWFNLAAYGAALDGVTDDSAARALAQTAMRVARPDGGAGGVLFIHGTAVLSGTTLNSGETLRGSGPGSSGIKLKAASNGPAVLSAAAATDVGVYDILVDSNKTNQTSGDGGVSMYGAVRFHVERVRSTHAFHYNFKASDSAQNGTGTPSTDGIFLNCSASDCTWQNFAATCARRVTWLRCVGDTAGIHAFDLERNSSTDFLEDLDLIACSVVSCTAEAFSISDTQTTANVKGIMLVNPFVLAATTGLNIGLRCQVSGGFIGPGVTGAGVYFPANGGKASGTSLKGTVIAGVGSHGIQIADQTPDIKDLELDVRVEGCLGRGMNLICLNHGTIRGTVKNNAVYGVLFTQGGNNAVSNTTLAAHIYDDGTSTQTTPFSQLGAATGNIVTDSPGLIAGLGATTPSIVNTLVTSPNPFKCAVYITTGATNNVPQVNIGGTNTGQTVPISTTAKLVGIVPASGTIQLNGATLTGTTWLWIPAE